MPARVRRLPAAAALAAALAGAGGSAGGATPPGPAEEATGTAYLGVQGDTLSTGEGGAAVSLLLTWPTGPTSSVAFGLSGHRTGGSRWRYVRLGQALRPHPRLVLDVSADLGDGSNRTPAGEDRFEYHIYRLAATTTLVPRRLYLELGNQYIDVAPSDGNLIRAGFTVIPHPRLLLGLNWYTTTGGNLGARYSAARLDWTAGRTRLFAGYTRGRQVPALQAAIGQIPPAMHSDEGFGGAVLPFRRGTLTAALSWLEGDGFRRQTLTLVLGHPLAGL